MKDINELSLKELRKEVRSEASKANKRLRRLEQYGLDSASKAYQWVRTKAFDEDDSLTETYKKETSFKTAVSDRSLQQLRSELSTLRTFLYEAKTSTVIGTKSAYQKGFKTFKDKYGTEASFKEFSDAWSSKAVEMLRQMFPSDEVVAVATKAYEDGLSDSQLSDIAEEALRNGGSQTTFNRLYSEKIDTQHNSAGEAIFNF